MKHRWIFLLLLIGEVYAQDTLSGRFMVPYSVFAYHPVYASNDNLVKANSITFVTNHAFFLKSEGGDAQMVDTVFITNSFLDDYMLPGVMLEALPSTKTRGRFCPFVSLNVTYSLPSSSYWKNVNDHSDLRFADCQMNIAVKDLGIHQARLINRLGSAPKDHFVERPVRVLYVLEFVELKGACEPLDSLDR
jgi:hypothetical protein